MRKKINPARLKQELNNRSANYSTIPVSPAQRGFLVALIEKAVGGELDRKEVMEFLFGVRSSKKLKPQEVRVFLQYFTGGEKIKLKEFAETEKFSLIRSELVACFILHQKEKGQKEMFPKKSTEKIIEVLYG